MTKRRSTPVGLIVLTIALFIALVSAIAFVTLRPRGEPAASAVATSTPAAEPPKKKTTASAPAKSPQDPVVAPSVPTTGFVVTAPNQNGHRLLVDGKLIGDSPQRVEVSCGPHSVQFGSKSAPQKLDVKCGEELVVRLR